jgi:hypothetical protein
LFFIALFKRSTYNNGDQSTSAEIPLNEEDAMTYRIGSNRIVPLAATLLLLLSVSRLFASQQSYNDGFAYFFNNDVSLQAAACDGGGMGPDGFCDPVSQCAMQINACEQTVVDSTCTNYCYSTWGTGGDGIDCIDGCQSAADIDCHDSPWVGFCIW